MQNVNNHPPSLRVFVVTEMWERYGFYVVQTLLALFLALHFKWPDKNVYFLVSSFTALNYISPLIGGWIADHLLGQKRAILVGATVLLISYVSLALMTSDHGLTLYLAGITVGTGLLKPNISSLLGNEYPDGSPERESGFTIFYMGLAGGIILGTILPSQLSQQFGWSVSFASAGMAMIIAIAVFAFGIKHYRIADYHPYEFQYPKIIKVIFTIMLLWMGVFYILNYPALANYMVVGIVIWCIGYFFHAIRHESELQARKTVVIGLLCLISVLFWAFYFQMFMSLTLFILRVVDPMLYGIKFYPPYYISIQSIGLIIFGYLLTRKKRYLNLEQRGRQTANKFLLSMFFMMVAYFLIAVICHLSTSDTLLSPLYFISVYLLISLAEILLSPVGLSAVSLLASTKKVSTMIGIFFVTLGIGAFLSGKLADLTIVPLGDLSIIELKTHYSKVFTQQCYILLGATLVCIFFNYAIKYLLRTSIKLSNSLEYARTSSGEST